jgi:hypothetical protein
MSRVSDLSPEISCGRTSAPRSCTAIKGAPTLRAGYRVGSTWRVLSADDFRSPFRARVGRTAALSPQSGLSINACDSKRSCSRSSRRIGSAVNKRYLYLYVDGVHVDAGEKWEKTAGSRRSP